MGVSQFSLAKKQKKKYKEQKYSEKLDLDFLIFIWIVEGHTYYQIWYVLVPTLLVLPISHSRVWAATDPASCRGSIPLTQESEER